MNEQKIHGQKKLVFSLESKQGKKAGGNNFKKGRYAPLECARTRQRRSFRGPAGESETLPADGLFSIHFKGKYASIKND